MDGSSKSRREVQQIIGLKFATKSKLRLCAFQSLRIPTVNVADFFGLVHETQTYDAGYIVIVVIFGLGVDDDER